MAVNCWKWGMFSIRVFFMNREEPISSNSEMQNHNLKIEIVVRVFIIWDKYYRISQINMLCKLNVEVTTHLFELVTCLKEICSKKFYLFEKVSFEIPVSARAARSEWSPNEKSDGRHFSMLMIVRINLWSLSWNTLSSINKMTWRKGNYFGDYNDVIYNIL